MSMNMVYTQHARELEEYLKSKLPDLPAHTAQEIGAHFANKTMILVSDMMREHDREIKYAISKGSRRRKPELPEED